MKNKHLLLPAAVVLVLGGSTVAASVTLADRSEVNVGLYEQIDRAAQSYRSRQRIASEGERAKTTLTALQKERAEIEQEQRLLRLHLSQLQDSWKALEADGVTASHATRGAPVIRAQQRTVLTLAKERYLAELQRPLFLAPEPFALDALWSASATDTIAAVSVARVMLPEVLAAQSRLAALDERSVLVVQQIEKTTEVARRAEEALTSIKGITRDVHEQVLLLQGELARIDAQLRTKAERALIEKGLLSPRHGMEHAAAPVMAWPVSGPVSAGFRNASYLQHFGVPHLGMDIVVPQDTPVKSAAEGIVFLVRDGGATGYTYILIGHKDGVATLYGHLSSTSVAAGQRVAVGQEIGRSGGTPGTVGAGPMTTGAHVHFEVIQDGTNIDPRSVLP